MSFSAQDFFDKIAKLGEKVVKPAKRLYEVYTDPTSSTADKVIATTALVYFIIPVDSIPDITPILGYTDDISIMLGAIAKINK